MYVKYATTLLKNWLLKNGCKLKKEATTTSSSYFLFGEIEIRIGDHLPSNVDPNKIYIMISQNNKQFGCFARRSFVIFNKLSELKLFLNNLFIILNSEFQMKLCKGMQELNEIQNRIDASTTDKDKKIIDLQKRCKELEQAVIKRNNQIEQLKGQKK